MTCMMDLFATSGRQAAFPVWFPSFGQGNLSSALWPCPLLLQGVNPARSSDRVVHGYLASMLSASVKIENVTVVGKNSGGENGG